MRKKYYYKKKRKSEIELFISGLVNIIIFILKGIALIIKETIDIWKSFDKIEEIKKEENIKIKTNPHLKNAIRNFELKSKNKNRIKISNKEKGDIYEEYIAKHYRELGYTVLEHGKEKGVKDRGIDLIAKKEKEIIFIQCKDWNINNEYRINHLHVKALRTEVRDFINETNEYKGYNLRLRFIVSNNILHKSAYKYIQEHSKIIDYEIIKKERYNNLLT